MLELSLFSNRKPAIWCTSLLCWFPGITVLILVAGVTFYSYNLLALVLEHQARLGRRQLRFRDMAADILGGRFYVGPLQFGVCYGSVIACMLLGGQSLKLYFIICHFVQVIYLLHNPEGSLKLYHFISMFGTMILILAQLHSFRYINLASLVLCLLFRAFATSSITRSSCLRQADNHTQLKSCSPMCEPYY